jgi:hypothetical protein
MGGNVLRATHEVNAQARLRLTLNGYTAAETSLHFTLAMMVARLVIAAISSLAAGAVAGWIAPRGATPAVLGAALLAAFIPAHARLWPLFPLWYRLTFLLTLVPLVVLGGLLVQRLRPT